MHLKRFVLHWAKCLLWYPANSATYLQVVINHWHDFVVCYYYLYIYFLFFICFQISSALHNIPAHPTPEWDGYEGRVSIEMLLEILPPPPNAGHERELLIAVCGPDAFTQHMVR